MAVGVVMFSLGIFFFVTAVGVLPFFGAGGEGRGGAGRGGGFFLKYLLLKAGVCFSIRCCFSMSIFSFFLFPYPLWEGLWELFFFF